MTEGMTERERSQSLNASVRGLTPSGSPKHRSPMSATEKSFDSLSQMSRGLDSPPALLLSL